MTTITNNEGVLEDSHLVLHGCLYLVDDKVTVSNIAGTVADLKRSLNAKEVKKYDETAGSDFIFESDR